MRRIKLGMLVVTLAGALLSFTACGGKSVNLNDYVKVEYAGYDGFGTAQASIDYDKLKSDGSIDEKTIAAVGMVANGSFDKADGLFNGDKIKYTWDIDKDKLKSVKKNYGINLKCKDFSEKVEGLKDPSEFDVNDILDIKYEGAAPNAKLNISSKVDGFKVTADKTDGLSNGDEITLTIDASDPTYTTFEEVCGQNNLPVFDTTIKYKVEGVPSLVQSLDEISDNMKAAIKKAADEKREAFVESLNKDDHNRNIESMQLIGASVFENYDSNVLVLFYEIHWGAPDADVITYEYDYITGVDDRKDVEEDYTVELDTGATSEIIGGKAFVGLESIEKTKEAVEEWFDVENITISDF